MDINSKQLVTSPILENDGRIDWFSNSKFLVLISLGQMDLNSKTLVTSLIFENDGRIDWFNNSYFWFSSVQVRWI